MALPQPALNFFIVKLSRILAALLGERAHAQIVITVKDGVLQPVHVNRTYLPDNLPQV